jgi:hypothetical protein
MAKIDLPLNFTRFIWASSGEAVEPTDAKKQQGWIAEIPPFQFENWINNRTQTALSHIIQHGISEWDATVEYQEGQSYVQDEDGVIYRALQTHTGVNPKYDDQGFWERPFDFSALKELASTTDTGVVRMASQQDIEQGTPGSIVASTAQLRQMIENIQAEWVRSGILDPSVLPEPSTTHRGGVRAARQQDIDNGTGEDRFVNPVQLKSVSDEIKATTAGVAIQGNPVVTAGTFADYTITNYSSFDTYSVSVEFVDGGSGSATITDHIVTVNVDPGSTGGAILTVTKSGVDYSFEIAIGESRVDRPVITFPGNGSTDIINTVTFQSTDFRTTPAGFGDVHVSSDWQVATDPSFINVVASSLEDTVNLTQWQVSPALDLETTYYARVRHRGNTLGISSWSTTVMFTTAARPDTPIIISPTNGQIDVEENPTITTSAFSSPVAENHQATDWEIRLVSNNSLVWSSYNNTSNKTSITVPSGVLNESTEYLIRVRYIGSQLGASAWGTSTFTTEEQFFTFDPSSAGQPLGGGYYAGANIIVNGTTYALVVAPKAQGGEAPSTLQWKTSQTTTSGTDSTNNGRSNTAAMIDAGASAHPAANFCANLNINGFNDWHLPSADELEICYRYLKPGTGSNNTDSRSLHGATNGTNPNSDPVGAGYTSSNPAQTSLIIYQTGGAEAFFENYYWSSTQSSASYAWGQSFFNGYQFTSTKTTSTYVRAVRWVEV